MYVKIKVQAGAKKEKVEQISHDHFDISVREKAEHNYANDRILEIMHEKFPHSIIKLVSGHHSPSKIVSIKVKKV